MKYFFGCTFMSREELADIGVRYPIKLDYYKTQTNKVDIKKGNTIKYGVEVIKTSYIEKGINIEKQSVPDIIEDEIKINQILDKLKQNKVTPISAGYIIEDLLKESANTIKK